MTLPLAHVGSGTLEPLQLVVPFAAGIAYLVRARTLERQGRPVPPLRQASFALGLALAVAALVSPLDHLGEELLLAHMVQHLGEELLLAHMVQHLAMADLGALLIVIGLTGPILQPLLSIRAVDRLRFLAHPMVALPLWALNLYLWHLPPLYQGALASEWLHALQHFTFVAFGVNMWMSLLGPLPMPEWFGNGAKLAYLVAVRLAGALLANVLMWSEVVLYPDYAPGEEEWGISPLADQALAGVIMMVEGSILTIILLGWLFMKAAREGEERQRLLEFAARHGLELSERRAARAVGAGRGADLWRRLEGAVAGDRSSAESEAAGARAGSRVAAPDGSAGVPPARVP